MNLTSSNMTSNTQSQILKQKIILITGASDGIGKQAALSFAQQGATPILLGKSVTKLEMVYDQIQAQSGIQPAIVPLDLQGATAKHYRDMATTIEQEFGQLDGLLHNASILGQLCPFSEIKEDEFDQVMQVNLKSQFLMTQALIPVLKLAPQASIVFTTSTVGSQGRAFWGTYSMSKFATEGMMQILAEEYCNSSLRFNCINPGGTRTNMRAKAFPAENANKLKSPADIMQPYVYLMSDESVKEQGKTLIAQPK